MNALVRDIAHACRGLRRAPGFVLLAVLVLGGASVGRGQRDDPLAFEIGRWSSVLASHASDENWKQVKAASEAALGQAKEALNGDRRLFALQRLAAARENLAATDYVESRPAVDRTAAGFEAEWTKAGLALRDDLATSAPASFDPIHPAAVRAVAEAAWRQVRVYYEASLEYGRNTMPDSGLYYVGVAHAQHDLVALCRRLASPTRGSAPALRPLHAELDALESDVLAAYLPPASIDHHPDFIRVSASIKEARELDAAGLRYGALVRYLQAALRFAPLRASAATTPTADAATLRQFQGRYGENAAVDHSIARLFLEQAETDPATAAAIAADILPRYGAAIAPARRETAKAAPRITVTLVRWPYT
jgi:hypothetical protein